MYSSIVYGYGFHCDCDDQKFVDFIKNHKETFCQSEKEKEIFDKMDEESCDVQELFLSYPCDATGQEGQGAVISNIMARETDIRFICCMPDGDCNTLASVVFEEGYPWQMNQTEKNLTGKDLERICKTYMEELGIEDDPDFLSL